MYCRPHEKKCKLPHAVQASSSRADKDPFQSLLIETSVVASDPLASSDPGSDMNSSANWNSLSPGDKAAMRVITISVCVRRQGTHRHSEQAKSSLVSSFLTQS